MGCDIHLYREKLINGKWVTGDVWVPDTEWYDPNEMPEPRLEVPWQGRFTERNYRLFGVLAKGVRYDSDIAMECRGFPADACVEVSAEYDHWGLDAHSPSWLQLQELRNLLAMYSVLRSEEEDYVAKPLSEIIKSLEELNGDGQRIVFWFDN